MDKARLSIVLRADKFMRLIFHSCWFFSVGERFPNHFSETVAGKCWSWHDCMGKHNLVKEMNIRLGDFKASVIIRAGPWREGTTKRSLKINIKSPQVVG